MAPASSLVLTKTYVFDPRPRFRFQIAAKRYWIEDPDADDLTLSGAHKDALTLVFVHGGGYHKEHWDLTIQRLFDNQQAYPEGTVRFQDMWSLDLPHHGDSAILNEKDLELHDEIFSWQDYARSVHAFCAGLGTGVDADFSKRKLVLVGHSIGCPVIVLATTYYPFLKLSSAHLIEPVLLGLESRQYFEYLPRITSKRTDIWSSSEEAFRRWRKQGFDTWDDRVLKIYVEHGLRPLFTVEHPDLKKGVTLKCAKRHEAAAYRDHASCSVAYNYLPHFLKEIPTHITYGMIADFLPEDRLQNALEVGSGGISNFAGVTRVPGVGHLVLQTHPETVGEVIWKSLTKPRASFPKNSESIVARL